MIKQVIMHVWSQIVEQGEMEHSAKGRLCSGAGKLLTVLPLAVEQ